MTRRDPRLASARRVVARLTERERQHLQVCGTCHFAGLDVYKRCAAGWQLAKELSRAKYAAADRDIESAGGTNQEVLF